MNQPQAPLRDRFWSKVNKTDTCWLWTASLIDGYGQFSIKRKSVRAHRVAYQMLVGAIPRGLQLDHLCRVRHCVNPAHLEIVTRRENLVRGNGFPGVLSRRTHCNHGHSLTDPYPQTAIADVERATYSTAGRAVDGT